MRRILYALVVSAIALTSVVRSQTPTVSATKTTPTSVSAKSEPQPVKAVEDCACESQVLPEALAIVNGVRITARDIEKATGDSVRQLQHKVVEARKQELDLLINSRLLSVEAKKRGISTTKLLEQEVVAKVKAPIDTEVQTFYDQNKVRFQEDFKDVSEDILRFMLDQRQRLEAKRFADVLRGASETKVQVTEVTPPRNQAERARVLATVNGETITSGDVEDSIQPVIFDVQERIYKQARAFFEQNKDRVSGDFAQTRDSIIRYLEQTEVRVAERSFVDDPPTT